MYAAARPRPAQIGTLAAIYPGVWGVAQLVTGGLSDRIGRKGLIVGGHVGSGGEASAWWSAPTFTTFAVGNLLLGVGTAMVYPTLLAAIGDVAHPTWRASAVGVYRLWRDLGYAVGAVLAGVVADAFGLTAAMGTVAALTFGSGLVVAVRMRETLRRDPPPVAVDPGPRCVELAGLAQMPDAVVIDVRSPDEYAFAFSRSGSRSVLRGALDP
jgi:MFS family permease